MEGGMIGRKECREGGRGDRKERMEEGMDA